MNFDITDYVIRYNCLYNTGNIFYEGAFKINDGRTVSIVRSGDVPNNILNECFDSAILENRDDGLVAKCLFSKNDLGKIAKDAVNQQEYGLSIYANNINYDTLGYPVTVKNIKSGWVLAVILVPMCAIPRPKTSDAGDEKES